VRNAATIAGNLALAATGTFESDMATMLLALDAVVTLAAPDAGAKGKHSLSDIALPEFLCGDRSKALIVSIRIPLLSSNARHAPSAPCLPCLHAHQSISGLSALRVQVPQQEDRGARRQRACAPQHVVPHAL